MNEIILHGGLREMHGESFKIDCRDPVEAYRAMACQLSGFREAIREGEFVLVREMPNGSFALTEEMLFLSMHNCKLHFVPQVAGASKQGKKGGIKLILGVILVAASLFTPFGAIIGASIGVMAGAALALGGLALLLAPTPKLDTGEGDAKNSFLFNGNTNPSGQNFAVPIGFGKFRIPGLPVATQIVTNQYGASYNIEGTGGLIGQAGGKA